MKFSLGAWIFIWKILNVARGCRSVATFSQQLAIILSNLQFSPASKKKKSNLNDFKLVLLTENSWNRLTDGDDRGQSKIRHRRVGKRVVERDQGVPVSSRWCNRGHSHLQPRRPRHGRQLPADGADPSQTPVAQVISITPTANFLKTRWKYVY